jgi:hypothetical protein
VSSAPGASHSGLGGMDIAGPPASRRRSQTGAFQQKQEDEGLRQEHVHMLIKTALHSNCTALLQRTFAGASRRLQSRHGGSRVPLGSTAGWLPILQARHSYQSSP